MFIAVNSGNNAKSVAGYLKSVKWDKPAIADPDRSFEKAMKMTPPLSLRNVWQTRTIMPDGRLMGTINIDDVLAQAKWKIDPETIPASIKPAWKAFEFGDYSSAIPAIRRYTNSRDEKTKAAATAINTAIDAEFNKAMAGAKKFESSDNKFEAYKAFGRIAVRFRGHPKASEATAAERRLARDKDLADEVKAMSALKKVEAQLNSRNRSARRAAVGMLNAIAQRYPTTEAGIKAKDMAAAATEK